MKVLTGLARCATCNKDVTEWQECYDVESFGFDPAKVEPPLVICVNCLHEYEGADNYDESDNYDGPEYYPAPGTYQ